VKVVLTTLRVFGSCFLWNTWRSDRRLLHQWDKSGETDQ
jgi:hypothetical protein